MSAGEPFRRYGDERWKHDHQEQHDQLGDQERPDAFDDVFHADARHAANDVEDNANRRRDQADRVVDDEEHAEIDGVDAGLLDDRHQDRRQNQNGRRHVERGADDYDQQHDRQHQERLVAHERTNEIDDLRGDLGDRDQPGRDQRGGDQKHDDAGAERGRNEDLVEFADLQLAIDACGDEQGVDGDDHGGFGRREHAESQADDDDRRQHQCPEAVNEGPHDLAQRLS